MTDGYKVNFDALAEAATGVNGTILALQNNKVSDIDGKKADYGDGDLGGMIADFCDRWEIGVEHLIKDSKEVANRLALSALAYAKAEKTSVARLHGLLQSRTGADPAAGQW
ncbi:hypothetical protein [Actinoallomurus soli]|uniref:hypothetical protein n=1 Tax=Actinoallomurus soli TaxID=2952535 RepID=UPI0020937E7E|nr:hypothetical protein [Actinoallomurus soli]MCO5967692.1 hypothetical protein [Actinoallomurus soli]